MSSPTASALTLNGKCLAFHGPLLYEARILKIWNAETKTMTTSDGTLKQDQPGDGSDKLKQEIARIPTEIVNTGTCYFIHYQGWKSTWDEWVGADRIRVYSEENIALRDRLVQEAKEAKKTQKQEQKKRKQQQQQQQPQQQEQAGRSRPQSAPTSKKRHLDSGSSGDNNSGRGSGSSSSRQHEGPNSTTKQSSSSSGSGNSSTLQKERSHTDKPESSRGRAASPSPLSTNRNSSHQQYPFDPSSYSSISQRNMPKIILHIPLKLKSVLVDDWELVTKDKKICKLPRPQDQSVTGILNRYRKAATEENLNHSLVMESMLDEYILGLKLYFNECLPRLLLYRLERLQYETILKQLNGKIGENGGPALAGTTLCDIYGSIHLLRLLSILPELMSSTTMGAQSCNVIIKQSESLLVWMVLNFDELFDITGKTDADGDHYYVNTSSQYEGVALGM